MSYIKWSGIESIKYGLTADWFVSAYYGNDNDVDGVGLYNPSTNPLGHGGKTRPFATLDKLITVVSTFDIFVLDSGYYNLSTTFQGNTLTCIGDGNVIVDSSVSLTVVRGYNLNVINSSFFSSRATKRDCSVAYSIVNDRDSNLSNDRNVFIECRFSFTTYIGGGYYNSTFIRCSGNIALGVSGSWNNIFIDCPNLVLQISTPRPSGFIIDYSVIIGTVSTSATINNKTTGVTIEDFKIDGNYFIKSYSEVDLWGNASGSGATTVQIQELFCNYFSPIYIDTWQEVNLHLKTTAPDIIKFGGLNGTYIGALPTMHWFTAKDLFDNYKDTANTTDLELDSISDALVIVDGAETGTFTSTRISLPSPIAADPAVFVANLVYNLEGSVLQGVSNQRIDTTPDLEPDNTEDQRVVYDFRMQTAPNNTDPLTAFKNYELDRAPTVDASGNSNVGDNFDPATETKQIIQDFIIEFTLRKIIIE